MDVAVAVGVGVAVGVEVGVCVGVGVALAVGVDVGVAVEVGVEVGVGVMVGVNVGVFVGRGVGVRVGVGVGGRRRARKTTSVERNGPKSWRLMSLLVGLFGQGMMTKPRNLAGYSTVIRRRSSPRKLRFMKNRYPESVVIFRPSTRPSGPKRVTRAPGSWKSPPPVKNVSHPPWPTRSTNTCTVIWARHRWFGFPGSQGGRGVGVGCGVMVGRGEAVGVSVGG